MFSSAGGEPLYFGVCVHQVESVRSAHASNQSEQDPAHAQPHQQPGHAVRRREKEWLEEREGKGRSGVFNCSTVLIYAHIRGVGAVRQRADTHLYIHAESRGPFTL